MRVLRFATQRCLAAIPTIVLVSLGAYLLLEAAPGDAADAYLAQTGGDAGFAEALRRDLGLDAALLQRLLRFSIGLLHEDLGISVVFNRPVIEVVLERIPTTLLLMGSAVAFAALAGSILGYWAGVRPGGMRDRVISLSALVLLAIPNFWLALLLILRGSPPLAAHGWLAKSR
jgi:peptide/nickel transport system permease protein